ncbi:peptidyl-alpha-hydroxyglycine alpha-amidating lyase family protein [Chloroflexota bacterium]
MRYGRNKYTYELVESWAKLPEGDSFVDVTGICIDSDDKIYAFNRSKRPMIVLDRSGNEVMSWGEGQFKRPHGSYMAPNGHIFLTDDSNHVVYKFTKEGNLLMTIGNMGQPSDTGLRSGRDIFERISSIKRSAEPFNLPTGVAVSSTGDIFVTDGYGNARVHKFNADGKLLLSWGDPGPGPGQFRLPHDIWIDSKDRIWVSDRENSRVQIFDSEGKFLDQWTDLIRPTHVYIDKYETVYVSELCRRISIFSIDGKLLARWGNESYSMDEEPLLVAPHVICADSRGDLYVGEVAKTFGKVDRGARTIQKFARIA